MNSGFNFAVAVSALAWSAMAAAQTPAAPPAMPAIPPHQCVKPEIPAESVAATRINTFNRNITAYSECIKKYVEDTKALMSAAQAAGNAAVDEFNKFAAEVKAQKESKQ